MRASPRRSLALLSAAALGLAACGSDGSEGDDPSAAPEAPESEDGSAGTPEGDAGDELSPEDLEEGELPDDLAQQEPPSFEDGEIEDGEALPGVMLDVSGADETTAQPGAAGGGIFEARFSDQAASVLVVAEPVEVGIEELEQGIEQQLEQDDSTTLTSELQEVDIEGADEARVAEYEGSTPDGAEASGSLLIATASGNVVQLVTETEPDSGFDSQAVIDTLAFDQERLQSLAG